MNSIDTMVGRKMRLRRMALGLNQSELGAAIGVRFQQVQKYESGANRVSASRLWSVARALDVPVSYFFEGADMLPSEAEHSNPLDQFDLLFDRDVVDVCNIFVALPQRQKHAVLEFLRSISANSTSGKMGASG